MSANLQISAISSVSGKPQENSEEKTANRNDLLDGLRRAQSISFSLARNFNFRFARHSGTIASVITRNTSVLSYRPPLEMENPTRDNICRNCAFDLIPSHL